MFVIVTLNTQKMLDTELACIFIAYLCTKFHMPTFNEPLDIDIKGETIYTFCAAIILYVK